YASMLGHCSKNKTEHARLLRSLVDDPDKRVTSGVDGILASYVMLQPKEGWKYLRGILKDSKQDFMMRYAALRSVRFFVDYRADVIGGEVSVEVDGEVLIQKDFAEEVIHHHH